QIVMNTFPSPLDEWAVKEAESAVNTSRISLHQKVSTNIPRDKAGPLILKEFYGSVKPDSKVILYLLTVIDYMAADILKLAGNFVKNSGRSCIFDYDIKVSMNADKALMTLFSQDINTRHFSIDVRDISTTNEIGWSESFPGYNGGDS
uniref:hypothetical protein n=1 Tax=Salmonella sp. s51228 TaxID=3159652 RepID=UPI0039807CE5